MKIKQSVKRKLALFLSCLLMMQILFTGGGVSAADPAENEYNLIGTPRNAFSEIKIKFADKVGDANAFWFRISGVLNDGYLQSEYDSFLYPEDGEGGMDMADWDADHQGFNRYEDYLNAQEGLPPIKFSVGLKLLGDVAFDIDKQLTGDIITDGTDEYPSEVIGRYTLQVSTKGTSPRLEVTLDKMVYNRSQVTFGENIFASFADNCKPESTVAVTPGSGSNDFTVAVEEYGEGTPEDSSYEIEKKMNQDAGDPMTITYTISANVKDAKIPKRGSASEAEATASAAEAGSKEEKRASESDSDSDEPLDPENDEDWEDDGDGIFSGPGIFSSLIDLMTPESSIDMSRVATGYDAQTTEDLRGKKITDKIPTGLEVLKVTSEINKGESIELTEQNVNESGQIQENGYQMAEDGTLTYVIPFLEDMDAPVNFATLTITTRLSEEEYNKYMLSGAKKTWNFANKAYLRGEGGSPLAISKNITAKIEFPAPFLKEGKPVDSSNRIIEWTLKVNSRFSSGRVKLYAVDFIENSNRTHDYMMDPSFKINGVSKGVIHLADQTDATYSYDAMADVTKIEEFIEANKEAIGGSSSSPIIYRYPAVATADADGIADAESSNFNSIMLIPLAGYENQECTITYQTEVTANLDELLGGSLPLKLENYAKILWKWIGAEGGPGPGEENEFGNATIGKTPALNCSLVDKTAPSGYDETNNTINWQFEINQLAMDVDSLKIEDIFVNSQQKLIGLTNAEGVYQPLELKPWGETGTGTLREIPYADSSDGSIVGDYYTLKEIEVTVDANGTITEAVNGEKPAVKLTIFLKGMTAEEHYKLDIKTFIKDPSLTTNATETKVKNTAHVTARKDDKVNSFDTSADCNVTNTLIRKEVIPFDNGTYYNFDDNTVKWRVTINPHYWQIAEPVITDTLPLSEMTAQGTNFAALTAVYKESKENNGVVRTALVLAHEASDTSIPPITVWTATDANSDVVVQVLQEKSVEDSYGKLMFRFADNTGAREAHDVIINESYTFEFTTQVTPEARNEIFRSNKTEQASMAKLPNTAKLDGWWIDKETREEVAITASDKAVNVMLPPPMTKSGVYFEKKVNVPIGPLGDPTTDTVYGVDWTLLVNRTNSDMGGAVITDNIRDCMELAVNTMEVYTVELDEKGAEKEGSGKMLYPTQGVGLSKFAFGTATDPGGLAYDHFSATIPEAYSSSTLKFKFTTVMVDDAVSSEITNDVSIVGKGWSDKTDNAVVDKVEDFYLNDYATAAQLSFIKLYKTSGHEVTSFPLDGAEFKIYELTPPTVGREQIASWDSDGNQGIEIKTRKTNKKGSLSFMFLKKNTMYKIVETVPPAGYKKSDLTWYVVPYPDSDGTYPSTPVTQPEGKPYVVEVKAGDKSYHSMYVKNDPDGGGVEGSAMLTFKKQGQGGQILPGVTFTATHESLGPRTAISGADGIVTFEVLEPNQKYRITETPPTGYTTGVTLYAKTTWDDENKVATAKLVEPFPDGYDETKKVLTNAPIKRTGSFMKTDQNGAPILNNTNGITFSVARRGDGGELLRTASLESEPQICLDVDTDPRMTANTVGQSSTGFYTYDLCKTVTVNKDTGIIELENFLYGDYELVETVFPEGIHDSTKAVKVYVRVDKSGIFASETPITENNLTTWQGESIAGEDGTGLKVKNTMEYGFLQIHKALGDNTNSDGILEAVMESGNPTFLSGRTFEIYYNTGTPVTPKQGTKLLTLKTNEDGAFTINTDGSYTDANNTSKNLWLIVGNYLLKEVSSSPDKYEIPTKPAPFTIEKENTTTVSWNGKEYSTVTAATKADTPAYFLNGPKRGELALQKVDVENTSKKLNDAKFEVWTGLASKENAKYVANLEYVQSYNNNAGAYVLRAATPTHANLVTTDTDGLTYLTGDDTQGYKLIYGTYYLKEVKTPDYYVTPADEVRFKVVIDSTEETMLPNNTNITNTVIKKDVELTKKVEVRKQMSEGAFDTSFEKYVFDIGFGFTLTAETGEGEGPLGGSFQSRTDVMANDEGRVKFEGVPVGTYTLTETKIPEKYGTTDAPFIKLMDPITVTVAVDGVTFEYADHATEAHHMIATSSEAIQESSTTNTTVEDGKLVVRNNCLFGSATGTKKGILPSGLSGTEHAPDIALADVPFTLTNTVGLTMNVKSDLKGILSFTDLPYGVYTLTETVPRGYIGEPITFEVKGTTPVEIESSSGKRQIDNTLILKSLKFSKVDQNGEPLTMDGTEKITFDIVRDGRSIPVILPNNYTIPASAQVEGGVLTVEKLPYGTYTLTENIPPNSIIEADSAVRLQVTIEEDSADTSKTKMTIAKLNAGDTPSGAKSITQSSSQITTYDFTTEGDTQFKAVNRVKQGDLKIKKVLGEEGTNGAIATNTSLKDMTFEIYKNVNNIQPTEDQEPWITLKTGEDGSFVKDEEGKYGGKDLLVGNYFLKEVFTNTVYQPLKESAYIPFTIQNGKTTQVSYNGTAALATVTERDTEEMNFLNIPKRGTITLSKTDAGSTETPVSGAEFGVYTDEQCTNTNQVASLKEGQGASAVPGTYLLDGTGFIEKKAGDVPYVYRSSDAVPWKILVGTYYVKETKRPDGYLLPTSNVAQSVTIDNNNDSIELKATNTLEQVDVKFLKVDQNDDPVKAASDSAKTKLSFTLTRITSGDTASDLDTLATELIEEQAISNNADGAVEIKNLVAGQYQLEENDALWVENSKETLYITVAHQEDSTPKVTLSTKQNPVEDANSKTISSATADGTAHPLYDFSTGDTKYSLRNQLKYGLVDILKVGAELDPNNEGRLELTDSAPILEGAVFGVYLEKPNLDAPTQSPLEPVLTLVTGSNGRFMKDAENRYLNQEGKEQDYRLVYYSTYYLHEISVPTAQNDKYSADPNYYLFEIGDDIPGQSTDQAITYYIGTNKKSGISPVVDIEVTHETAGAGLRFPNAPTGRGTVSLRKTDAETDNLVKGAEFDIYDSVTSHKIGVLKDNNDGTYVPYLGEGTDYVNVNASGQHYLKLLDGTWKLLTGTYYIKESKAPAGYRLPDAADNRWNFYVPIGEPVTESKLRPQQDGKAKPFTNTLWKRDVTVPKLVEDLTAGTFHPAGSQNTDDEFTFLLKGTKTNGALYEVYQSTNDSGQAVFSSVPAGEYNLTEVMTGEAKQNSELTLADVYNTTVPEDGITVKVDENGVVFTPGAADAQTEVKNTLKRGSVTGHKFTEDATGKVLLAGAEFELTPVTPKRDGVFSAKSDEKGEFIFNDVPLGTYELRENKTPDANHYLEDDTVITVVLTEENANVTTGLVNTASQPIEFMNEAFGTLTLKKQAQVIVGNTIDDINGVLQPGQGFVFKVTGNSFDDRAIETFLTKADIEGASSVTIDGTGIYVTTGATGTVLFKNLPLGSYKVQEQENEKNNETGSYALDASEKAADITVIHASGKVEQPLVTVENKLKRGHLQGIKTTGDKTTPLKNASIGLFPTGTTSFIEANLWCGQKAVSGEDGKYLFEKLPYGTYIVAELAAPEGYHLNTTTSYEITVNSETVKTTGLLTEGTLPKETQETPILIANTKKSSGGGGGGGGGLPPVDPNKPGTGPGAPTEPETQPGGPTEPGTPTLPNVPTVPVVPDPGGGNIVEIPPEIPPGSNIVVTDPNGDTVYEGTTGEDGNLHVDLPPGDYILTSIDENGIPLAQMVFTIEDEAAPLAMMAPDAGDHAVPIAVLAIILLGALAGVAVVLKKRRDLDSEDKQTK